MVRRLSQWFSRHGRSLFFRQQRSPDPYSVWILEVMSQQTTLTAVEQFFRRWMQKFPTVQSLAAASEQDVVLAWQGLGYYSRARNLRRAAQQISESMARGQGWFRTREQWRELPGVGPYIANMVTAMCFGGRHLPLDGNVLRVWSRMLDLRDPLNDSTQRRQIELSLEQFSAQIVAGNHGVVAEALIDLGATVCTKHKPQCEVCPLSQWCQHFHRDLKGRFPLAKERRQLSKEISLFIHWRVIAGTTHLLMRQRGAGEQMANMWALPALQGPPAQAAPFEPSWTREAVRVAMFRHVITSHNFEASLYLYKPLKTKEKSITPLGFRWIPLSDLAGIPLDGFVRKALSCLLAKTSSKMVPSVRELADQLKESRELARIFS